MQISTGRLFTRGLYTGRRCTRLWSDLPRGGRGDELYASLLLAYNKSSVLLSLVWQVIYFVNVGRVEDREALLKSPEMAKRACGCCVCSEL